MTFLGGGSERAIQVGLKVSRNRRPNETRARDTKSGREWGEAGLGEGNIIAGFAAVLYVQLVLARYFMLEFNRTSER